MSLSERIKEARVNAGLTQQALADILGVKSNTITGYETGSREPDALRIIAIARATGVTGDFLLETEDIVDNEKLSKEALDLARKYDALDEWGRRAIDAIMLVEEQRCSSRGHRPMTTAELKARAANVPILKEVSEELTEKSV